MFVHTSMLIHTTDIVYIIVIVNNKTYTDITSSPHSVSHSCPYLHVYTFLVHPSSRLVLSFVLCYSATEYTYHVWGRSTHANKIDSVLNKASRAITGCLKPTQVEDVYLLCGTAPIRRSSVSRLERSRTVTLATIYSNMNQHPIECP